MALRIIVKNPMNTGIWTIIGRHPLSGLTLFSLYSSHCFAVSFCTSSLYFSFKAFSFGASACIRFIERVLAAVNGQKIARSNR